MDAGIGLRAPHVGDLIAGKARAAWLEVHAENYMGGGRAQRALLSLRATHPISLHCVGLNLGSTQALDAPHVERLRTLVEAIEPVFVSDHLAFTGIGGVFTNALLPIIYDEDTLEIVVAKVGALQERIRRRVLIENPSLYLAFRDSNIAEPQFLAELAKRSGCGLLCDVNNIVVSAANVGFDPVTYLDDLPAVAICEIHLAGHTERALAEGRLLVDDHGSAVPDRVMALYSTALRRFGPVPTLVEWDTRIPELSVLLAEARRADAVAAAAGGPHT
jgi:uncharacterized protein (UPF0276 family)